ncbi:MAG: NlpC/P60 family protein [Pseudomonadota bacterium]
MTVAPSSGKPDTRAAVLDAARGWLGTPYRHQASLKGVGADCLGLLRGVWREVMGTEPEAPGPYTPHWAETGRRERMLEAASRHLEPIAAEAALPGDVLIFRVRPRGLAKHLGILSATPLAEGRLIHAYSGHAVCETALGPFWIRRIAGAFRFPTGDT